MRAAFSAWLAAGLRFLDAGHDRFARGGQFIDPVGAVHHEGAFRAERDQSARPTSRTRLGASTPITCDAGCGGIGERSAEIEDGAKPERAAQRADGLHRRVIERRKQKHESGLAQALDGQFRAELDRHAEGFEHVGRPALRSDRAIAVLGHFGSGGRGHQRRAAGDVEGQRTAAAGAARIDQFVALFVGERNGHGTARA